MSQVHGLIAEEEKSVPSDKIFVGGFSQGGAVALYSGLTYKNKLAGILYSGLTYKNKLAGILRPFIVVSFPITQRYRCFLHSPNIWS